MKIRKENVLGHAVHKINYFEKRLGYPLNQFTKKQLKSSNSQNVQNLAGLVVLWYVSFILPVYKDKPRVGIAALKRSIKY